MYKCVNRSWSTTAYVKESGLKPFEAAEEAACILKVSCALF